MPGAAFRAVVLAGAGPFIFPLVPAAVALVGIDEAVAFLGVLRLSKLEAAGKFFL